MKLEIRSDPRVQEFLQNRNLKKNSIKRYLTALTRYSDFHDLAPELLIQEAERDEDSSPRMRNRRIKGRLLDFRNLLEAEGRRSNTINNYMSLIRSFYGEFDIELPRLRTRRNRDDIPITTKDIVGKDEIREALTHANLKYQAIILLMASSGMGMSEVINLTLRDFLDGLKEYHKNRDYRVNSVPLTIRSLLQKDDLITTWHIRRFKTGMPFITFSSPEANIAILKYLQDRYTTGYHPKGIDDWLFESQGRKINISTFSRHFQKINDRCGWAFQGAQRFFTSHQLRKFFASTLHAKQVPELTTHWLLGHKINTITEAYFKADIKSLKMEYTRILDNLSIEKVKIKTVTTPEYDSLINKLQSKDIETRSLKNELEDIKSKLSSLNELVEAMENPKVRKVIAEESKN